MEPVHFIWLGPNPGPKAYNTPNDVASKVGAHRVMFWCMDAHAPSFAGDLAPGIRVKTLGGLEGKKLKVGGTWKARAFDVMETMREYGAFVAAKDLLVFLVLHTYGGYFLDTTTMIASHGDVGAAAVRLGVSGCWASTALNKRHHVPHCIRVEGGGTVTHQFGLMSPRAITVGYDPNVDDGSSMPLVDVWAQYSPVNHAVMKAAVESYVRRCETLGLNKSGVALNDRGISGGRILDRIPMNQHETDDVLARNRNELIGNLAAHALYDGYVAFHGDEPRKVTKHSWVATAFNPPDADPDGPRMDIVPELGLIKRYTGSWRV